MEPLSPTGYASGDPIDLATAEERLALPEGIDSDLVEQIDQDGLPLRQWPAAVAELYHATVTSRLYQEGHFLFLLGLLTCLATIVVDVLINPAMVPEGVALRVLAVAPLTLLGLMAGTRGWTNLLAFCVGASPIAFIAVVVHLAVHLPPDLSPRYINATILIVGLANVMLPYSLRGLIIFDLSALVVAMLMLVLGGVDFATQHLDTIALFTLVAGATIPVASQFESLRQSNFLLTLRAQCAGRELLEANAALHTLSETDPLTGISNRRSFERQFETDIVAPGFNGRIDDRIALMMIDLDHFKSFNDAHGHQAGDSCLKLVAKALVDIFDEAGGVVARYGGEEFVAALRVRDSKEIVAVAEDVRRSIATVLTPVSESDRSLITASIGVGVAPASAMLPREELIEMADAALYSGKDAGRNRVEVVEAEPAFGRGG
ncbi:GGDEF domain-containing protein [Erythrobacter sp. Alg231-14]|uniref:GGDEF domain-containing protein n=1 Tax=Erythrobacter sp. Alg231-14 TaxID=1922225 RepID=UPI00307B5744